MSQALSQCLSSSRAHDNWIDRDSFFARFTNILSLSIRVSRIEMDKNVFKGLYSFPFPREGKCVIFNNRKQYRTLSWRFSYVWICNLIYKYSHKVTKIAYDFLKNISCKCSGSFKRIDNVFVYYWSLDGYWTRNIA